MSTITSTPFFNNGLTSSSAVNSSTSFLKQATQSTPIYSNTSNTSTITSFVSPFTQPNILKSITPTYSITSYDLLSPTIQKITVDTPYMAPIYSDTSVYTTPFSKPLHITSPFIMSNSSSSSDFDLPGVFTVPYKTSLDLSYSQPLYGMYTDIGHNNPDIQNRFIDYYYYKTLDDWLFDELSDLINYFKIDSSDKVSKVKYNENNSDSYKSKDVEKIVNYIKKNLLLKDDMTHILHKLVKEYNIGWGSLQNKESRIRKAVKKFLKSKLEKEKEKEKRIKSLKIKLLLLFINNNKSY